MCPVEINAPGKRAFARWHVRVRACLGSEGVRRACTLTPQVPCVCVPVTGVGPSIWQASAAAAQALIATDAGRAAALRRCGHHCNRGTSSSSASSLRSRQTLTTSRVTSAASTQTREACCELCAVGPKCHSAAGLAQNVRRATSKINTLCPHHRGESPAVCQNKPPPPLPPHPPPLPHGSADSCIGLTAGELRYWWGRVRNATLPKPVDMSTWAGPIECAASHTLLLWMSTPRTRMHGTSVAPLTWQRTTATRHGHRRWHSSTFSAWWCQPQLLCCKTVGCTGWSTCRLDLLRMETARTYVSHFATA